MLDQLLSGTTQSKQQFGEEGKRFCFMPKNKMHGTLGMVDIAMDRVHIAKKEQLLAEKKEEILVCKI